VRDINPGSASGIPPSLSVVAARLLYPAAHNVRIMLSATDGVNGGEPWVTDGTAAGTAMLSDVNPGAANSASAGFTRAGGQVFFTANDGTSGIELWVVPLGAFGGALAEPFGAGCPGTGNNVPVSSAGGGHPIIGNAAFAIGVSQARPSSVAILMLDAPATPLALPGGCTLYTPRLLLTLAAATDPSGIATAPLGIPADLSLVGASVVTQWTVLDPAGAFLGQLSFSDALRLLIGT
jgi:ELWxxDGT repeat protein